MKSQIIRKLLQLCFESSSYFQDIPEKNFTGDRTCSPFVGIVPTHYGLLVFLFDNVLLSQPPYSATPWIPSSAREYPTELVYSSCTPRSSARKTLQVRSPDRPVPAKLCADDSFESLELFCGDYLLPATGLEPVRPHGSADFKSAVSTDSTTPALAAILNVSGGLGQQGFY